MATNQCYSSADLQRHELWGSKLPVGRGILSPRGPSLVTGDVLKPDIVGPAVNILAAWPDFTGASVDKFVFKTGTSMSTPHLSGVAALLKASHPDWSPTAIKSAIMTTASWIDRDGHAITDDRTGAGASDVALGAGHVDPMRANDPGLVYDIDRRRIKCSEAGQISAEQLNYPSIMVNLDLLPVSVRVRPEKLKFSKTGEKKSFEVEFRNLLLVGYAEGRLMWVSGARVMSTPMVMYL